LALLDRLTVIAAEHDDGDIDLLRVGGDLFRRLGPIVEVFAYETAAFPAFSKDGDFWAIRKPVFQAVCEKQSQSVADRRDNERRLGNGRVRVRGGAVRTLRRAARIIRLAVPVCRGAILAVRHDPSHSWLAARPPAMLRMAAKDAAKEFREGVLRERRAGRRARQQCAKEERHNAAQGPYVPRHGGHYSASRTPWHPCCDSSLNSVPHNLDAWSGFGVNRQQLGGI